MNLWGSLGQSLGGRNLNKTTFNLTSILKQNLLDDDGLEDMHFYQVAFSRHKQLLLSGKEERLMMEQVKRECYDRGEIDCLEDLKGHKRQKRN